MTRKQLFTELNRLCEQLDFEYNINCGGCCFVAAVIAEQLEYYNIPYLVYEYICPCHYVIKVSDRYINRQDFHNSKDLMENYTSNDLFDLYYNEDWNKMYSRKWNLIVKSKIKSLFRKYGNKRT